MWRKVSAGSGWSPCLRALKAVAACGLPRLKKKLDLLVKMEFFFFMDDTTIYVIFSIIGVLVAGPILFLIWQLRP